MIRLAAPAALLALPILVLLLIVRRHRIRELLLPALAALALVFALAAPELRRPFAQEEVMILLDQSPSVLSAGGQEAAEAAVASIRSASPGRRVGVIAFASRARLVLSADDPGPTGSILPLPDELGERTDLASAVALASAVLPEGGRSQIVLVSDGQITDGLLEALGQARAANFPISVVPVGQTVEADAALARLELPPSVSLGRTFRILVDVQCQKPGDALLALYRDGELVASTNISWVGKEERFEIQDAVLEPGTHTYRAVVRRPGDPIPENDSLSCLTQAETAPPLLIVSSGLPPALVAVLDASGTQYRVSATVPPLEELVDHRAILLAGLALGGLSATEVNTLRSFAGDLGGGVLVAQGRRELGGLRSGGVENLLPVSYTLPQRAEEASLAVVYLLDRSASMLGHAEGAVKIDVVREAAAASVDLLTPDTLAGVISFDRDYRWLQPVAPVLGGRPIYESLQTLEASGGTDLYYPIVAALDSLEQVSARVKHILVLTDGKTVDEVRDWEGLIARLEAQSDIHLSVIAVGPHPNASLLDRLAAAGHGTAYAAVDVSSLPAISMEATQQLARARFVTEETPVAGPLASGPLSAIPPLSGYALTYPRPTAEVLLSAGHDPILARWRVGLGWIGALNADLAGLWTRDWLAWSRAPLLVDALLGSVEAGTRVAQGLRPSVNVGESALHVRLEAQDADGDFANFLAVEASLLPRGDTVSLTQTSAGYYEAALPALPEGGYALTVTDRTRGRVARLSFSVPYPAEYRRTGVDEASLRLIAQSTGGAVLQSGVLPALDVGRGRGAYVPIDRQALLLALTLFLLELVRRRLMPQRSRPARRGRQTEPQP